MQLTISRMYDLVGNICHILMCILQTKAKCQPIGMKNLLKWNTTPCLYVLFVGGWWKFVYFVKHEHRTKDVHCQTSSGRAFERVAMSPHSVTLPEETYSTVVINAVAWAETTWSNAHTTDSVIRNKQKRIVLRNFVERDFWIVKVPAW